MIAQCQINWLKIFSAGLLDPCNVEDMACLTKSTEQFLNNTAKGIAQYDIRAIDPMFIPVIESDFKRVKYTYTNLTLIGLKDLKIADFRWVIKKKYILQKYSLKNSLMVLLYGKSVEMISKTYALLSILWPS